MAKSMTRKFLSALGIEEDKADQIIDQHTAVTDELKSERDSYKADAEKLKTVEAELATAKAKIKAFEDAKDGENPYEKKYNDLKAEYDKYKGDVTAKEAKAAKEKAYRAMLKEIGIPDKRLDSILRVTDIDKVELDKEGTLKDKENLSKTAKDEWSEFIPTKSQVGADTKNPPANNGKAMTKEEILKIKDTTERQAAIAAHLDLFDKEA